MSRFVLITLSVALLLSGSPAVILSAAPEFLPPPNYPGFPQTDDISGRVDMSSPAVVDINNDGKLDIMLGDNAGCVRAWHADGASSGQTISGFPWTTNISGNCNGDDRIEGALAVGDVDGNDGGLPEVAAGTRGISVNDGPFTLGKVFLWDHNGSVKWNRPMLWNGPNSDTPEVQTVVLANLSGAADLEVVAGTTNHACSNCSKNVYAWNVAGNLLNAINFPTGGIDAGIFGAVAVGNLTGDGYAEIITGRDHRFMYVYNAQGASLPGWPKETFVTGSSGSYLEYTNTGAAIADLNFDGVQEIVMAAKVRSQGHQETGTGVVVFRPDGSRHSGWSSAKLYGMPLYTSFPPSMYPALGDIDRDGKLDIVIAMADGYLRAFRENGTLMWQYNFAQGKVLFGSEPVIGDITGDGFPEIIFGTYSPNSGDGTANAAVRMIGLDRNGAPLTGLGFPLTLPNESQFYGVRAAPTLADLDQNGDIELMAGSWGGTLYVWDLQNAPMPTCGPLEWPTSRHDNLRSGFYNGPTLNPVGGGSLAPDLPAAPLGGSTIYLPLIIRC